MWELVLVVSVYRKEDWATGLDTGQDPVVENSFHQSLCGGTEQLHVSQALIRATAAATNWLNVIRPSLWSHTVVTVYSLEELSDDA